MQSISRATYFKMYWCKGTVHKHLQRRRHTKHKNRKVSRMTYTMMCTFNQRKLEKLDKTKPKKKKIIVWKRFCGSGTITCAGTLNQAKSKTRFHSSLEIKKLKAFTAQCIHLGTLRVHVTHLKKLSTIGFFHSRHFDLSEQEKHRWSLLHEQWLHSI